LSPALAPASSFHACADLLLPKPEASDLRLMIDVRRHKTCQTYDQKDHYACRMDPIERARLVTATRMLQDEQLSNPFPLHNDKQRYEPSLPQGSVKQDFPG
jgi:hypothetical protein